MEDDHQFATALSIELQSWLSQEPSAISDSPNFPVVCDSAAYELNLSGYRFIYAVPQATLTDVARDIVANVMEMDAAQRRITRQEPQRSSSHRYREDGHGRNSGDGHRSSGRRPSRHRSGDHDRSSGRHRSGRHRSGGSHRYDRFGAQENDYPSSGRYPVGSEPGENHRNDRFDGELQSRYPGYHVDSSLGPPPGRLGRVERSYVSDSDLESEWEVPPPEWIQPSPRHFSPPPRHFSPPPRHFSPPPRQHSPPPHQHSPPPWGQPPPRQSSPSPPPRERRSSGRQASNVGASSEAEDCSICFTEKATEKFTHCEHKFCFGCVVQLEVAAFTSPSTSNPSCPICRQGSANRSPRLVAAVEAELRRRGVRQVRR